MKKDFETYNQFNDILNKEKHKTKDNKLNSHERLAILFDNGEFKEIFKYSSLSNFAENFNDGVVCAFGNVNNKPIMAYATDFSFEGGSIGIHQAKQISEIYRLAKNHGIPIVGLLESGGAKLTESIHIMESYAGILKDAVFASGYIPQIACTFGHCIGATAFLALLNDFIVMEKNSNISIAGANINKQATGEDLTQEEIGGTDIHTKHSGAAHFVELGEENSIKKVREILSWLPQNNKEKSFIKITEDSENREEESIFNILPEDEMKPFDIKKLVKLFTDNNEFLEIQKDFAKNIIIGFARFSGIPVGIIANQPAYMGGALDSKAFKKVTKFINILSNYNLPMISFVDVPGAVPTSEEHKKGILNLGAAYLQALGHHKELKLSILVRKCFGGTYSMINPKISGGDIIYAYPNASVGIMSERAMATILGENSKIKQKMDLLHEKGLRLDHPVFAVSSSYIDDIIDPKKTRIEIIKVLKAFKNKYLIDIPDKKVFNFPL
ncbi:MAG: carboxyl transferase domain-containing protein [Candidatus Sericytochromatia bacterium]